MVIPITTNNAAIRGRDFYFKTLSSNPEASVRRLVTLLELGYLDDGDGNFDPRLPAELQGQFDAGFFYEFVRIDIVEEGLITSKFQFVRDQFGQKLPRLFSYSATEGDDGIFIVGNNRLSNTNDNPYSSVGQDLYALYLSTVRLGGGNDYLQVVDSRYLIPSVVTQDVNIKSAAGFVFQSNIFAGEGDDFISPLLPRESVFKGGTNTDYSSVVLSDDLTLEELSVGDTLELLGSRYDWDIEFKDGDGDGSVTLASILDERDYIALSNNNRVYGFERLKFGDIYFDLVLYDQLDSNVTYGQPEYFLEGSDSDGAPVLNSTIARGSELWEAFRFNRIIMQGIAGSATSRVDVYTGSNDDTPNLTGALQFANLYTESGVDIVELGSASQSSFNLGDGDDVIFVKGLFSKSFGFGGNGRDNIIIDKLANSTIDAGAGDDVVEILSSSSNGSFDGGPGSDLFVFSATESSFGFRYSTDPLTGVVTLIDNQANTYIGFDRFTFVDKSFSLSALLAAIDSNFASPIDEAPLTLDGGLMILVGPNAGVVDLTGTGKGDVLIGSNQSNRIYGGAGADIMSGLLGADIFRFRLSDGLSQGDRITDFNPFEDRIQLADVTRSSKIASLFRGQAEFARKNSSKLLAIVDSRRSAEISKSQFAYDRMSGSLYYNQNGRKQGFGQGGEIANLSILIDFQASNITLLYNDQLF